MRRKFVMFDGENSSYLEGSDASVLIKGQVYYVISVTDLGPQKTSYELEGFEGKFNSLCFHDVYPKTYFATSDKVPEVGAEMNLDRFTPQKKWQGVRTSSVQEVMQIGDNMYEVYTRNSLYIIQVI